MVMAFNAIFNNISVMSRQSVLFWCQECQEKITDLPEA
jgi:hypothetical protein